MKEVVFQENGELIHISLKEAHAFLRKRLGISDTVYGCFPSDMDEIVLKGNYENNGEGCTVVYIVARGKLFELDETNKRYAPVEMDLRELKQK